MILQIHIGVNGRVVDEETGEGIPDIVVSVRGIDKNFTTDEFGYFWRLLTGGTYTLSFSKHGYVVLYVPVCFHYFYGLIKTQLV